MTPVKSVVVDKDHGDKDELDVIHAVTAEIGTIFTWDYERSRLPLMKLYEKAKTSQWNASTDLDWSVDVDPEKVADELGQGGTARFQALADAEDSPVKHFGDKEWRQVGVELQNSLLSQFMHGEQGALLCTARIVETVPWIDAKYYAATQVVDEARHVEVFAALPRREARHAVRDQREPQGHPRRHPLRSALGHRVPRHADHGRRSRARRVRVDATDHDRAAPEEVAALRHE